MDLAVAADHEQVLEAIASQPFPPSGTPAAMGTREPRTLGEAFHISP